MNSFRLRLALLVGAIAAAFFLAAGFLAWELTTRFSLGRLDRELRQLAKANLERIVDASHWTRVDDALAFVSGKGRPPAYLLRVRNYDREEYRSPGWPAGIDPESFPAPTAYEDGSPHDPPPPPPKKAEISPRNPALPSKEPYFRTVTAEGSQWRVGVLGNPYTTLLIAVNLDEFNAELRRLRHRFLAALPFVLLALGGGAWWFAARALRPVAALTQAVERINERGLDQRIMARAHDREFQRLITVFNAMMDRLERGFHQARRFSADASHELKTPLALLQLEVEQALQGAAPGSPQQQLCTSLLEEIHGLKAVLDKLLLLAMADSGRLALERTAVDLSLVVANVAEDVAALAPGLALESALAPGLTVEADAVLLEQALQNLTGNAVKYNRPGGRILLRLTAEADRAVLTVGNSGPGIPGAERDRIFERFYRSDPARRRDRPAGTGLGLSISREILRAHGGELALVRAEADWTEFMATLPLTMQAGRALGKGGSGSGN